MSGLLIKSHSIDPSLQKGYVSMKISMSSSPRTLCLNYFIVNREIWDQFPCYCNNKACSLLPVSLLLYIGVLVNGSINRMHCTNLG